MIDVFISYTRSDRSFARALAIAAAERGFTVWWDHELNAGAYFQDEIAQLISEAKAVIVLWSRQSLSSKWVKSEASHAFDRDVLVPAMLHPLQPPVPFNTTHTHDLSQWMGDPADPVISDFMEVVSKRVGERESQQRMDGEVALADQDRLNQQEMEFWQSVRTKKRRSDLEQFIAQFPASPFTPLAREWLAQKRRSLPWRRSLAFAIGALAVAALAVDLIDGRLTPLTYGHALYLTLDQPEQIAISDSVKQELSAEIDVMADHLEAQLKTVLADPNSQEPWEVAQMTVALSGLRELPTAEIVNYVEARRDQTCDCWGETPGLGDVGATSWVLTAQAHLGADLRETAVLALLDQQFQDGSWPLYYDTVDETRYSSSYATAWAAIALMHQASLAPQDSLLRSRIDLAVQRARIFLRQAVPTRADRRLDYPSVPTSLRSHSLAALSVVVGSRLDASASEGYGVAWANALQRFEAPGYTERSDRVVYRRGGDQRFDTTSHTVLPWQLLAMTRVAKGSEFGVRLKANRLLLELDADGASLLKSDRAWHAAETLIALRGVLEGHFLDRIID